MRLKRKVMISLVTILILMSNVFVFAQENETNRNFASYQKVIDKINIELGASISIPNENKEQVYTSLLEIPLEEFEQNLRSDYLKAVKDFSNDVTLIQKGTSNSTILPRGATLTNQTQRCYFNNGIVGIDAQISVDTSSAIVKYSKITRAFSGQPSSGNYFKVNSNGVSISISSDSKKATIVYKGNLYTQNGLLLLSNRTVTVTYTAGGGNIYASFQVV